MKVKKICFIMIHNVCMFLCVSSQPKMNKVHMYLQDTKKNPRDISNNKQKKRLTLTKDIHITICKHLTFV